MRVPSRLLLAAAAVLGGGLISAAPAAAAEYRCSASALINDMGPGSDISPSTPCALSYETAGGQADSLAKANAAAQAGILKAGSSIATTDSVFITGRSYSFARENLLVSGLGVDGADLDFLVAVDGVLSSDAPGPTQFYAAAASSSFAAATYLITSRGLSATSRLSGCTRNPTSGISTCNGGFNFGPSQHEVVDALMPVSIHVWNGDILQVGLELSTGSLGYTPAPSDYAYSSADFGHTLYWGGIQFTDASRGVVLTGDSGFDYRFSAFPSDGVPEPASWALMILGFGAAGAVFRRRALAA